MGASLRKLSRKLPSEVDSLEVGVLPPQKAGADSNLE